MTTPALTDTEINQLREILKRVSFSDTSESKSPDGGNVTLTPGLGDRALGGVDGRVVLDNPGGTTRPMLTIRDGDREIDLFFGEQDPGPETEARTGALFLRMTNTGWPALYVRRAGQWDRF